jgi:hypothetical protein
MEHESKGLRAVFENIEGAFFKERVQFKKLLLANPNHFGNLDETFGKPVLKLSGNSFYEELGCVGYHPQQEMLEAVVYVKQQGGYGTDVCGSGTPEYVRFYTSRDNGASWQDEGLTSFQAFNIPAGVTGKQRLEYAASLKIAPKRRLCFVDNHLMQVRAILSWNNPPPAHAPNWTPVWGGVRTATVQVEPRRFFFPKDIFEIAKIKPALALTELLDSNQMLPAVQKTLSVADLSVLYKDEKVPQHRFAFKEIAQFAKLNTAISAETLTKFVPGITLDPGIFEQLFPTTDGNTGFEELTCIGLDPNHPDTLVGVIEVKKNAGYSGGPCTSGSTEYVSFWADFDGNGSFESFIGTGQVQVYDLPNIPGDGVHYAVRVPIDLTKFRQKCEKGAKAVRIRAILSWNHPVSDADEVPTWGNREETLIHIAPAVSAPAGKIAIIGGIAVSNISATSGLTLPGAVYAYNNLAPDSLGRACAFGARVTVNGTPINTFSYKVEVRPYNSAGAWNAVVTDIVATRSDGTTFVHSALPDGRFLYLDYTQNILSILAQWDTTGIELWDMRLTTFDTALNVAGVDLHRVQLYNKAPVADIVITAGTGDCGRFRIGDSMIGDFVARDVAAFPSGMLDMLASYSIGVEPVFSPPDPVVITPSGGTISTAAAPGDGWTLATTGMRSCGYIIRVVATNRTIINSASIGFQAADSSGFCLLMPDEV